MDDATAKKLAEQRERHFKWLHDRDQASNDPAAWATWARKLMTERSPAAARIIATRTTRGDTADASRELAARQVEEARAARLITSPAPPDQTT